MITNALHLVRAAAEPEPAPVFDYEVARRKLASRAAEAPVYHGRCNRRIAIQLQYVESNDHTAKRGLFGHGVYEQGFYEHVFELRISPAAPDSEDILGSAYVTVWVYPDRVVVNSTEPSSNLGDKWKHVLYNHTFHWRSILSAPTLLQVLDKELRRTNYYENFARWAQGLEPIPMLK